MRRVLTVSLLVLSLAAVGSAQTVTDASAARLTNGELASLILHVSQPEAAPMQPAVAMQEIQRLGLMPAHWLSNSVVTQASFSQTAERLGLDYAVNLPQSAVSRGSAEAFLASEKSVVQATVARQADPAIRPQNVLSDKRPFVTSSADFN